jgi:hypothetical protein
MPKRKTIDPLYKEVMAFATQKPSVEKRDRWLSLWQEHFAGVKMAATDVRYADFMTSEGASEAFREGDYLTAVGYIDTFLAHPNVAQADITFLTLLRCNRMFCLFYLGRETEAIELGCSLLVFERRSDLRVALILMRYGLYQFLLQAEPQQSASVDLTEFVWAVAQAIHFRKRRVIPSPAAFGQLSEALNQTWPRAEREQRRETAREQNREMAGRAQVGQKQSL